MSIGGSGKVEFCDLLDIFALPFPVSFAEFATYSCPTLATVNFGTSSVGEFAICESVDACESMDLDTLSAVMSLLSAPPSQHKALRVLSLRDAESAIQRLAGDCSNTFLNHEICSITMFFCFLSVAVHVHKKRCELSAEILESLRPGEEKYKLRSYEWMLSLCAGQTPSEGVFKR